ncbi:hypothetical protein SRHO_G00225060 [Serrasalmus rhombeus]
MVPLTELLLHKVTRFGTTSLLVQVPGGAIASDNSRGRTIASHSRGSGLLSSDIHKIGLGNFAGSAGGDAVEPPALQQRRCSFSDPRAPPPPRCLRSSSWICPAGLRAFSASFTFAFGCYSLCCSRFLHRLLSACLPSRDLHALGTAPCSLCSRAALPQCRMFRSRRSGLVRRLWRSRAPVEGDGEAGSSSGGGGGGGSGGGVLGGSGGTSGCCMGKPAGGNKASPGSEAELKALTHSVLKRIKEKQLEGLLQAVESRGGARSPCLLLPSKVDAKLGQQSYSLPLLLSKVFRWPDLRHGAELKRLPGCESYGKVNPELVCCNPHHMSRLCELGKPLYYPIYMTAVQY